LEAERAIPHAAALGAREAFKQADEEINEERMRADDAEAKLKTAEEAAAAAQKERDQALARAAEAEKKLGKSDSDWEAMRMAFIAFVQQPAVPEDIDFSSPVAALGGFCARLVRERAVLQDIERSPWLGDIDVKSSPVALRDLAAVVTTNRRRFSQVKQEPRLAGCPKGTSVEALQWLIEGNDGA